MPPLLRTQDRVVASLDTARTLTDPAVRVVVEDHHRARLGTTTHHRVGVAHHRVVVAVPVEVELA